jgi:hypothetical protein
MEADPATDNLDILPIVDENEGPTIDIVKSRSPRNWQEGLT